MRTSHWYYDPDYGVFTGHPHDPRSDYGDVDLELEAAKDELLRTPLFTPPAIERSARAKRSWDF